MFVRVLCTFLNWMVCRFVVELLEIFLYSGSKSLVTYMFANTLLFCGGHFILLMSFDAQKFLVLVKSNLFILSVVAWAFGVIPKIPLPNPKL